MARSQSHPQPEPIPADGGSYLLDPATGKWIDQSKPAECVMPIISAPAESNEIDA